MKFVINRCYGSLSVSKEAAEYANLQSMYDFSRQNPALIEFIETYGSAAASGDFARLVVVEVPEDMTDYIIEDYDGVETLYYVLDGKIHIAE